MTKTHSIPSRTTSVFSSTVTHLVLIYESVTSSASVVCWLTLHSWILNSLTNEFKWTLSLTSELYYDRRSVGQSVLEQSTHLGLMTKIFITVWPLRFFEMGRPLGREDGSVFYNVQYTIYNIFYCLRFQTRSLYLYPPGTGWPGYARLPNEPTNERFFITQCEPKREHYLDQFDCYYLFHPLLRNVCQSRDNALISTRVFVAKKRVFSEPLSSNGLFRHNIFCF
jgi:hypothetical protein